MSRVAGVSPEPVAVAVYHCDKSFAWQSNSFPPLTCDCLRSDLLSGLRSTRSLLIKIQLLEERAFYFLNERGTRVMSPSQTIREAGAAVTLILVQIRAATNKY